MVSAINNTVFLQSTGPAIPAVPAATSPATATGSPTLSPSGLASAAGGLAGPFAAGGTTQPATGSSTPATGQPSSTGTSSSGGTSTSALAGTDEFLQLLVAQLSNQDPTQPMDDQSFITELAQFNTVEQMINLTQTVTSEVNTEQSTEGVALLGKTVAYNIPGAGQTPSSSSQGLVTGVSVAGGQVTIEVNGSAVPLSQVTGIADDASSLPPAGSGASPAPASGQSSPGSGSTTPVTGANGSATAPAGAEQPASAAPLAGPSQGHSAGSGSNTGGHQTAPWPPPSSSADHHSTVPVRPVR